MKLKTVVLPRPMYAKIVEAENNFIRLLPAVRLKGRPPAVLLAAANLWSQMVWKVAEEMEPMPLSQQQITQGLQLAQHPVFICGVHRSGTTLLRDLLDGHPDLVVLPSEGTYYTNIEHKLQALPEHERVGYIGKEWLRRLANPINQPPYWLLGRSMDNHSAYVDFARYVLSWWKAIAHEADTQWPHTVIMLAYASCTNNLSAKLWVDKTPTNERFLTRIWQEMPSAKILHIIREPVATLASYKKMEPDGNFRWTLRFLKTSFNIAAKQSHNNDSKYLLIRYEALCNDPQKFTGMLASFLGIEQSATMNNTTVAGMPVQANSSFNNDAKAGSVLKQNEHLQLQSLTQSEQCLIAAYAGKQANKLDYPLKKVNLINKVYLLIKYRMFK